VLAGFALPWTIFAVAVFVAARHWRWRGNSSIDRLRVFCFVWIAVPLLFFSISQSKLPGYILPALPAIALLVGERITTYLHDHTGHRILRLTGALLMIMCAGGGFYLFRHSAVGRIWILIALLPIVAVALIALMRPQIGLALYLLIAVAMFVMSGVGLKRIAPALTQRYSVRDLIAAASARGYGATPLIALHEIDRTAEFYAATHLFYTPEVQPMRLEGATQVLVIAKANGGTVLCLVPIQYESQLTTYKDVQTEVIGNNGRLSLVVVRVP